MPPDQPQKPHLQPSDLKPESGSGGQGLTTPLQPGGTLPGGGPASGAEGALGTGGAQTGGADTGSKQRDGE